MSNERAWLQTATPVVSLPISGTVKCFQVERQFAQVFGFELPYFQFDGDKAVQAPVEEEQVQRKVARADLNGEFGTDKAEIAAQLDQKGFEFGEQALVQVEFAVIFRQPEEFQHIDVFERVKCAGVHLCHQW